jgi:hypothetical protein
MMSGRDDDEGTDSYSQRLLDLAEIEKFSPQAFIADETFGQDVCDFILTLAVVHSDFNDLDFAHQCLNTMRPKGAAKRTKEWGLFAGLELHLSKLRASLVHELLQLVNDHEATIGRACFQKLLRQTPKIDRDAWIAIVAAAQMRPGVGNLHHYLMMCRHKIASHYDRKMIGKGFRAKFSVDGDWPLISRGNSLKRTRFYFAEAAAQAALFPEGTAEPEIAQFITGRHEILWYINATLYQLVTRFVAIRGYAWSEHRDQGPSPTLTNR